MKILQMFTASDVKFSCSKSFLESSVKRYGACSHWPVDSSATTTICV